MLQTYVIIPFPQDWIPRKRNPGFVLVLFMTWPIPQPDGIQRYSSSPHSSQLAASERKDSWHVGWKLYSYIFYVLFMVIVILVSFEWRGVIHPRTNYPYDKIWEKCVLHCILHVIDHGVNRYPVMSNKEWLLDQSLHTSIPSLNGTPSSNSSNAEPGQLHPKTA